ncbi:hypothetical protein GPECTOR_11g203 [Gonium pectorale]|uniref:EF-hand domain-containing protein n=1 Tax=Gonium pectorale TaxID=33097 RepID=A0A150GPJ6_GONPE|nr:hypothetical protein GPECTOR_11g203 [Gonium pectorale]|eukprot:KXZ51759.1 hypothetical protein GPECTOR_11g203 [Gonium pectorale]
MGGQLVKVALEFKSRFPFKKEPELDEKGDAVYHCAPIKRFLALMLPTHYPLRTLACGANTCLYMEYTVTRTNVRVVQYEAVWVAAAIGEGTVTDDEGEAAEGAAGEGARRERHASIDNLSCREECTELFNSPELREAVQMVTNVPPRVLSEEDLEPFFKKADADRSGALSRTEFLALYLAVATERVKKNPLVVAEALFGFIDHDRNGVLEGNELKALLTILGFAPALLLPIPGFLKVEYRSILRTLDGTKDGSSA